MSVAAMVGIAHLCLLVLLFARAQHSHVVLPGALWVLAVVLAIVGPLCVLVLVGAQLRREAGKAMRSFEAAPVLDDASDNLISSLDTTRAVPLEDALLVNDASQRRDLVLNVLIQDEEDMASSLAMVRSSSDPEIAHYASSASMEMASSYEEALTSWSTRYEAHPQDEEVLTHYLSVLERYLSSGLAAGEVRRIQEARYREVLEHKIAVAPEEVDYFDLAKSQLAEGLYEDADATLVAMEASYPDADDTWLARLEYYYDLGKPDEIRRMIHEKDASSVSAPVRAEIEFWKKAGV